MSQPHDQYGKSVLRAAAGNTCRCDGVSIVTRYDRSSAHIDGTVGRMVAVEIESRTGKQVRGAVLDLILHAYPKKLLILVPMYIGPNQVSECQFILERFLAPNDFRVVLLEGTGHHPTLENDVAKVKGALCELGGTAVSLASDDASFVTGASFVVDGGFGSGLPPGS